MKDRSGDQNYTRTISPKLGLLGILGLLGFLGFLPWVLKVEAIPVPFLFFAFFGFFGFYYEGKMSHTLRDERFQSNAYRAAATANRYALMMIILTTIFCVSILHIQDAQVFLGILIAVVGLSFGLSVFLGQYLLYRYEHEE